MPHAAVEELRARLPVAGGRRLLPVRRPLDDLFPGGGLARGSVVAVDGSVWLALAVAAGASAAGSWCAVVGLPRLGAAAAAEVGLDLTRLVLVPSPGGQWATAVAALLDGVDVVLVRPPRDVKTGEARRLAARARERGGVLLTLGPWPEPADLRLRVDGSEWLGLHAGYGRIAARRCRVAAAGRGAAARERRVVTTLPDPGAYGAFTVYRVAGATGVRDVTGAESSERGAPSAAAAAGPLPVGGAPSSRTPVRPARSSLPRRPRPRGSPPPRPGAAPPPGAPDPPPRPA